MRVVVYTRNCWRSRVGISLLVLVLSWSLLNVFAPVSLETQLQSQVVVASNGLPLRKFADKRGMWRYPRAISDVSDLYLEVLLNYEDRYFYQHFGVNPGSLIRAAWQWLENGRIISGGSTITMQVARMIRPVDRNLWGKAWQILTALQLEWRYDKSQILTYYLNHAPFGGRVEGVEAASMFYFGHSAAELTYAQAALLAVLPQSPTRNRPDRNPRIAEAARNKVLHRMKVYGLLTEQELSYHMLEKVEVATDKMPVLAPLLSRRLVRESDAEVIHTTIDYDKQWAIAEIVKSYVRSIGDKVSAATLVVDNETAEVVAYVGSADFYDNARFAHVDMVQASRSPGSTLKPFIYGMALDLGLIHSQSMLMDVPLKFDEYLPENFNDRFSGPVAAETALASSLNVPAVQLLEQIGPQYFYIKSLNAGIPLQLPQFAKPNLAIALGGVSVSLESLVQGYMELSPLNSYQALIYQPDNSDKNFSASTTNDSTFMPMLSKDAAWIVHRMLQKHSKNTSINKLSRRGYAVKTGTSAGHADVWAMATSVKYTVGVWLGRPDNAALVGHQGSYTAVPLLQQIAGVLGNSGARASKPKRVSEQLICWPLGRWSEQDCLQTHKAWVIDQNVPYTLMAQKTQVGAINPNEIAIKTAIDSGLRLTNGCDLDHTSQMIPLWPEQVEDWLPSEWQNKSRITQIDPRCVQPDTLKQMNNIAIIGVEPGQTFQGLDGHSLPDLTLKALNQSGHYYWYVNGKLQSQESAPLTLTLTKGYYQVTLLDQLGKNVHVSFSVQ